MYDSTHELRKCARTVHSSSKASNPTFQPLIGSQEPPRIGVVPMIRVLHSCAVGSENVNGGCRMTAWREGWEIGPKLNLGMSNQFCVRDAMEESDFMDSFPNAQIFLFFARKTTFPAKKADSVGQRESRSAPTYRVRKAAQSSTKQGSDPRNTRRTARCCVLLGEWGVCGCLRRGCTIKRMMPRVLLGPSGGYSVLLFTFLHSVHGVSLRGSVSVGSGVRR